VDEITPQDATAALALLARSLDRLAVTSEKSLEISRASLGLSSSHLELAQETHHLLRPLRWCLPLAWVVTGIGLCTLAFTAYLTMQVMWDTRWHAARTTLEHQHLAPPGPQEEKPR
jgi:hypothetical protein